MTNYLLAKIAREYCDFGAYFTIPLPTRRSPLKALNVDSLIKDYYDRAENVHHFLGKLKASGVLMETNSFDEIVINSRWYLAIDIKSATYICWDAHKDTMCSKEFSFENSAKLLALIFRSLSPAHRPKDPRGRPARKGARKLKRSP